MATPICGQEPTDTCWTCLTLPTDSPAIAGLGTDAGVWFKAYMYACTLYDAYNFTCERGSGTYMYLMHKNTCAKLLGTGSTKLECESVFRCETIRSISKIPG